MAAVCSLMVLASACSASAACKVGYFAAVPVSLSPNGPTTSASINGHSVDLLVNSGAFYSFMPKETAQSINLQTKPISTNFGFSSGKGDIAATLGYVDELKFGEKRIPDAHFIVISGRNAPQTATLGQNILTINDAEFDLRGGIIRLSNPHECTGKDMAYWAQPDRVRSVTLEAPQGELDRQTIGRVLVNGVPMRAMFSSGGQTVISSKALTKIGLASDADKLDTIKLSKLNIGGEEKNDVAIKVVPGNLYPDVDLIIGLDFFLTHRIYVSKGRRSLLFTTNEESVPAASSGAP
jgi:predicted aspartyl protease